VRVGPTQPLDLDPIHLKNTAILALKRGILAQQNWSQARARLKERIFIQGLESGDSGVILFLLAPGKAELNDTRIGYVSCLSKNKGESMKVRFAHLIATTLLCAALPAQAVFIGNIQGGADFPQGAISFADAVVDYSPAIVGTSPTGPHRGDFNALNVPDYAGVNTCADQPSCTFVSLGNGGSITLRFVDNLLTGSGNADLDLWIFEVGPAIEDTFVEISKDGVAWNAVGMVTGSTAGIDIDAFGFGTADEFEFIRLTDNVNEGTGSGATAGADIDAVGAISTVVRVVPAPATLGLLAIGLLGLARVRRRPA
jgi:hypothetical protein